MNGDNDGERMRSAADQHYVMLYVDGEWGRDGCYHPRIIAEFDCLPSAMTETLAKRLLRQVDEQYVMILAVLLRRFAVDKSATWRLYASAALKKELAEVEASDFAAFTELSHGLLTQILDHYASLDGGLERLFKPDFDVMSGHVNLFRDDDRVFRTLVDAGLPLST